MIEDELFFEELNRLANFLQIIDFILNVQQVSNDELMKELTHQTQDYLETMNTKIVEMEKRQNAINEKLDKILTKLSSSVDELNENLETLNDDKK